MNCLLLYYTGTYNTRYLTDMLQERLVAKGIRVTRYEIDPLKTEKLDLSGYDLLGLGYPIYAFNAPWPFLKFIKKQDFPVSLQIFIYKNSGETYPVNDASSISILRKIKKDGGEVRNEYHFMMPYNIHFRFSDELVCEMLKMDRYLVDILIKEVLEGIPNRIPYKFRYRLISFVFKIQFIGGFVNSFFYKVKKNLCTGCSFCICNCPMHNISKNENGELKFGHNCIMCMRCSLYCPKDAIRIGILDLWGWRVNGPYHYENIVQLPEKKIITEKTDGFFRCYIKTYQQIESRHKELFENFENERK